MNRLRKLLILLSAFLAPLGAAPAFACAPVTIYFDWNSARITDDSRAAIERLAVTLAWKGPDLAYLLLTSHTDATGSAAANRAMALRRAQAVHDALTSFQVPAGLIRIQAVGAQRPRVATPGNVREPRNRRVELLVQLSAQGQARQIEDGRPIC